MGFSKQRQREMFSAGKMVPVQALTQASTATTIVNYGVTTITSAGSGTAGTHAFTLQNPVKGVEKSILVDPNSTREVKVVASTSVSWFGSTASSLTFSTGTGHRKVILVGLSTTQYGILAQSTGVSLTA